MARAAQKTDLGGYLDIVLDFLVYSAMVLAFAFAEPEANALASALLLFSFIGTGTTFLAFAVFAEKRGLKDTGDSPRGLYYLGGLTEGSETIIAFVLFCLFPARFALLATVFSAMCLITTASRIGFALHALKKQ